MEATNRRPPVQYRRRVNVDPCGGPDNLNNGCQVVFPRMDPSRTLCFLCVKLQDPAVAGPAQQNEIRDSNVQCGECGVCGATVTDPCGTCRRAENYENGTSDHEREQCAQRRRTNLDAQLHRDRNENPGHVGSTVPFDELQTIRATQGFGTAPHRSQANHCTVYYECRRSDSPKHADQMLGTGVLFFPDLNTMLALRSRIVKEVNGRWTEFYSAPLLEEETSLRAPNNYVFPSDNLIMTVAQWYQVYSRPEYRDTYIILPKLTQRKGKGNSKSYAFSVELYINVGLYVARTEDPELSGAGKAGAKRKASATCVVSSRAGAQSPKRVRDVRAGTIPSNNSGQTLRSLFVGDRDLITQTPPTISVAKIQFKKTTCLIAEGSGKPTLMEESSLLSGFLETRPFELSAGDRGTSKDVFSLRIDHKTYVAKKLINAGGGRSDDIPLSKATSLLTADLIRIKRMAYFADKFKTSAYDLGVDIAEFDVSEAFLIKLYKPSPPSPAENAPGGSNDDDHAHGDPAEELTGVYLVEPMRLTTTVIKFSGTLGSTTRRDLRSLTVAAFAHYVAQETACRYVFADIQGSNNANTDGKLSIMLFDPMTHTIEGTSGIGDHGLKGLQDFINYHVCNHICSALELASSEILQNTLDDLEQDEDRERSPEGEEA